MPIPCKAAQVNPTAYGTSPCQGKVARGQSYGQSHRESVFRIR
jgi:hypothetical protein